MLTHDPWTERLSEYLDDELEAAERTALEAHLETCAECRAMLDDLRVVVAMAGRLADRPPENDLWSGIAARIDAAESRPRVIELDTRRRLRLRRFSFSLPQLAAAGFALMLVSGGTVWMVRPGAGPAAGVTAAAPVSGPTTAGATTTAAPTVRLAADLGGPQYDAAVADLERVLDEGRDRLDPATIEILERNLAIIDQAIEEARRAVMQDPANAYLNNHLADNMKRKLDLLRYATAIVRAQS